MTFFDNEGNSRHDWNIFLDNFPSIGVFKLPHDSKEAFYDKNVAAMLHIDGDKMDKEQFYSLLDRLNENQVEGYKNIYNYTADGETSYIMIKIVYDTDYLMGFVQDVTQVMLTALHKEEPQEYDTLTGMYTRDCFIRHVRSELTQVSGTQCCMASVHINGIERIDSELNYDKTALCVTAAANVLKRFSGDNIIIGVKSYKDFFIFFKNMAKKEVADLLGKMNNAVRRCKLTDEFGNTIETRCEAFSITAGYCLYPVPASTIDMMINYSDFALFRARALGSTVKEFSAEEYITECNRYSDSKQLASILDDNNFTYCFQPIVSTIDGSVYAYEALMRPSGTSPLELLRIAREHDRLYEIELLTFENVLSIVSEHRSAFGEKKIFINSIPDAMITTEDFGRLCEKYGDIMPQIVIEFTEQADLTGEKTVKLRELFARYGCMTAIDDYGSGYSNTAAVLSLQPDILKIDRTLISDIDSNVKKQQFFTGIIEFANLNGIKVLAEGVETYDEMSVTIRRGANFIQGYYTARPQKELIPEIPDAISDQVRMLNMHRPDIMVNHYYTISSGEDVQADIKELIAQHYTGVVIGNATVHIKSSGCKDTLFEIKTEDGSQSRITLSDVGIKSNPPCIQLGKDSKAIIEVKGNNTLFYNGIFVPDGSELTLTGDGSLLIDISNNDSCCIGSSFNDTFGKITVDMDGGELEMRANGIHSICLGGGVSSCETPINLLSGDITVIANGKEAIGIGSYDGSCGIELGKVSIDASCSADNAVAIGSLCGYINVKARHSKLSLRALGEKAGCIGTLAGLKGDMPSMIDIEQSQLDLLMKARTGAAIGCRRTDSDITIKDSDIKIRAEGDKVAGIGSAECDGKLCIIGKAPEITLLAGEGSIPTGYPQHNAGPDSAFG